MMQATQVNCILLIIQMCLKSEKPLRHDHSGNGIFKSTFCRKKPHYIMQIAFKNPCIQVRTPSGFWQ